MMPRPGERADALAVLSAAIEVQSLLPVETLPGVVILAVAGRNGPGAGFLQVGAGKLLAWRPPDDTNDGPQVACDVDGDYLLEGADAPDRWLRVRVYADRLIPGTFASVFLRDVFSNAIAGDDVTAAEAAAGDVTTWQLAVTNRGSGTLNRIRVWLDAAVTGLELSSNGSDWSAPSDEASAVDLGDLGPGAAATLHLRRTILAAAAADPDVLHHLHFSFQGF